MIPRYMRIAYWALVAGIVVMALLLVRGSIRNHERILAMRDQSPIPAPTDTPNEKISVGRASDTDGAVSLEDATLPLPQEAALRAKVILDRTLTDLSLPASAHSVPPGPALTDVFLLPLPIRNPASAVSDSPSSWGRNPLSGNQLAVVNLTKTFADAHPSGVLSEDLTLHVIIATLHANFAEIAQVRFLVDGQTRPTLNGHADLARAYAVTDPKESIHTVVPGANPY